MKRVIKNRTKGHGHHGMITNLVSPSGIGNDIKPFVFLDYIHGVPPQGAGFGWHPHSGIATFTYYIDGGSDLEESTGNKVSFRAGDIEYLQAGSGAWHKGMLLKDQPTLGFQLWISLPPELETADASSVYVKPDEIFGNEHFKVLLGEYEGIKSKINPPNDMNYLDVNLGAGEKWTYTPPESHDILWLVVYEGKLSADLIASVGELIVYEEGNQHIELTSDHGVSFLLGSAKKFEHDLVSGRGSIHTSSSNLESSQNKIKEIYSDLVRKGTFNETV
ncbi:MAG: pirin family protein [Fulvivirga sp.]|uniref:pirin family protein n=1 Tax=Fulvivirga sp. TaxID=1931237 RepID=UPI0032ED8C51